MPLPTCQPVTKRLKGQTPGTPNIDDLDDYCLAKIIAFTFILSRHRDEPTSDTPTRPSTQDTAFAEKNLSLVSRRWYLLTQSLVASHGVHRITLRSDKISSTCTDSLAVKAPPKSLQARSISNLSRLQPPTMTGSKLKPPGVLATRNAVVSRPVLSGIQYAQTNGAKSMQRSQFQGQYLQQENCGRQLSSSSDITQFRALMPKFRKYSNLIIDGSIKCDELRKVLMGLNSARVERLQLKLVVQKDDTLPCSFGSMPSQLDHLRDLSFIWTTSDTSKLATNYSNAITWTIFLRANHLNNLEIYLHEAALPNVEEQNHRPDVARGLMNHQQQCETSIERISNEYLNGSISAFKKLPESNRCRYPHLQSLVFYRHPVGDDVGWSQYTQLIKNILNHVIQLDHLETNDRLVIEHMVELSKRACTQVQIRHLKFAAPIRAMQLLEDLVELAQTGTESLSLAFDSLEQIDQIRAIIENHFYSCQKLTLAPTKCSMSLQMRDQKLADVDEKIKQLSHLSRMAELTIQVTAQLRVSIDCCHLMWSVGRSLTMQGESGAGCLFKIILMTSVNANSKAYSEITVPFGTRQHFKLNPSREDPLRHREILKALKRGCYHSFVRGVRDNVLGVA